ncbi:MAG: tripartite tricarboxylate transporter substrate binding protein, partial [Chloroflexota bacterium]
PYPSKPIRIVSPLGPGGSGDTVARIVGEVLGDVLGQPVVIDNRPGANGIIGMDLVAKATPDGYMLLIATGGNIAVNAAMYAGKLPFDVARDLVPVTQVAAQIFIAIAAPSFSAKNIREVIELAKSKPGSINCASAGTGSSGHLMAVLLSGMAGIQFTHVPYKSGPLGRIAVVARESDVMIDGLVASLPLVKSGKLRGLGVTGMRRSELLPDVPTISEAGVPGYDAQAWYGMFVPRGTPRPIVEKLYSTTTQALQAPAKQEKMATQGADLVGSSPAEFSKFVTAEIAKWARVVRESGLKPD